MISALTAANVILEEAEKENRRLTPLQVMKLVYIAHGWHLAVTKAPLIRENIQAWQYGPVIPSLYRALKSFGSRQIEPPHIPTFFFDKQEAKEEQLATLRSVYETYGHLSGEALSNLTHRPGSPWSKVWRPGVTNLVIPDELIQRHYEEAKAKNVLTAA